MFFYILLDFIAILGYTFSKRNKDRVIILADKNKSNQNEINEDGALIALTDENGKEVVFEILGVVDYDNDEFAVLIENRADADEVVIFKIQSLDDENEEFVSVEDEELLNKVFELFKAQYDGYMKFE